MNMAGGLRRLKSMAPGSPNGNGAKGGGTSERVLTIVPLRGPRQALMVVAPVAIAGTVMYVAQRKRDDRGKAETARGATATLKGAATTARGAAATARGAANAARKRRRKPRNLLRYYGLAVLISALERDATRKAVIAALKWAQRRA